MNDERSDGALSRVASELVARRRLDQVATRTLRAIETAGEDLCDPAVPPRRTVRVLPGRFAEAARGARPGDRLMLAPGIYDGGVQVAARIAIVGEGSLGDVVIRGDSGPVLHVSADACLRNVVIQQTGPRTSTDEDDYDDETWDANDYVFRQYDEHPDLRTLAMSVTGARVSASGCRFVSSGDAALLAEGRRTSLSLDGCQVEGGAYGLTYRSGSTGDVTDSEIHGEVMSVVASGPGTAPLVRSSRISASRPISLPVLANGGASPRFDDCMIGEPAEGSALPRGTAAVSVGDPGTSPSVTRCVIEGFYIAAVEFRARAAGLLEDCQIRGGWNAGVKIVGRGTHPFVVNNVIPANDSAMRNGIMIERADGYVADNKLLGYTGAVPIRVEGSESAPTIRGNVVSGGSRGIALSDCDARVVDNEVTCAAGSLSVSGGAPHIESRLNGHVFIERSRAVVSGNEISGAFDGAADASGNGPGLYVGDGSQATVRDNRIHDWSGPGLFLRAAGGDVVRNTIFDNASGIYVWEPSRVDLTVEDNYIHGNEDSGIDVLDGGHAQIYDNDLEANLSGIVVRSASADISRNRIHDHLNHGVRVWFGGAVNLSLNYLWANADGDVEVWDHDGSTAEVGDDNVFWAPGIRGDL